MVNICHNAFVKNHRMHNIESEPQYQLWTLGDNSVMVEKAVHGNQEGISEKSLYFLPSFSVNLKLLLK